MRALSCETAVLKPCWGGDGVGVERVTTETCDAVAERLRRDLTRPLLVQEFLPEVEGGELSFVFVGGVIGHVVRKRPAPGEFRVNSRFSPLPRVVEAATARLLDDAHAVLDAVGEPTLYARIDGVERDGRLICTEVELADPSLYLDLEPSTAVRFAEATVEAARAQGGRTPWQRTQAPVTAPGSTTTISSRLT